MDSYAAGLKIRQLEASVSILKDEIRFLTSEVNRLTMLHLALAEGFNNLKNPQTKAVKKKA